jgi:hypothetical protein
MRQKPTIAVKVVSLSFLIAGVFLGLGFIKAVQDIPLASSNIHIFLTYIFLFLLCFFISFGLYRHKKWALYVGYTFALYIIVNFIISLSNNFLIDVIVAGLPILLIVLVVLGILRHKHKHFIH